MTPQQREDYIAAGLAVVFVALAAALITLWAGCCPPFCHRPDDATPTPFPTLTPTATSTFSPTPTLDPPTYEPTWTPTPHVPPTCTPRPLPTSAETDAAGYGWCVLRFACPVPVTCDEANRQNKHWIAVLCDATGRTGIGIYWRYLTVGECRDCSGGWPWVPVLRLEAGCRPSGGRPECVAEVPICDAGGYQLPPGEQRLLAAWDDCRCWIALLDGSDTAIWTQELCAPVQLTISRIAPGSAVQPVPEWGGRLNVDVTVEPRGEALRPSRPVWCPPVPTPTATAVPSGDLGAESGAVDLLVTVPADYPVSADPRVIACLSSPSLASGVWLRVRDNGLYLQVKGFGCQGATGWADSGYGNVPLVTGSYRCQWEQGRFLVTTPTGASIEVSVPYPLVVGSVDVDPPWAADRPGTDSGLDVTVTNRRTWRTNLEGVCE